MTFWCTQGVKGLKMCEVGRPTFYVFIMLLMETEREGKGVRYQSCCVTLIKGKGYPVGIYLF